MKDPAAYLPSFDKALQSVIEHEHAEYAVKAKESKTQFAVGFEGDFGDHHVTPRTLNSSYVNKLVCISGIVTKCSLVRPKVLKSVHYCEDTQVTSGGGGGRKGWRCLHQVCGGWCEADDA